MSEETANIPRLDAPTGSVYHGPDDEGEEQHPRKRATHPRKRATHTHLVHRPTSTHDDNRNEEFNDDDCEPTPRASIKTYTSRPPASEITDVGSSSTSSVLDDAHSFASHDSPSNRHKRKRPTSPRKHAVILAVEKIAKPISFSTARPPPELESLVQSVKSLAAGRGIVSPAQKDVLKSLATTDYQFEWVEDKAFATIPPIENPRTAEVTASGTSTITTQQPCGSPHVDRDRLGPTPDVATVKRIWSKANDCQEFQHSEGQWNCTVHHPILDTALGEVPHVDFCHCTTAQIHKDVTLSKKTSSHNKKIDFCMFVRRDGMRALETKAMAGPFNSINHTEHPPLLTRPLAVSIETKVGGHAWGEAMNQTSIWLVAQWDWLDKLCTTVGDEQPGVNDTPTIANAESTEDSSSLRPSAAAAAGLVFLPGIIVLGHDWYLVAVTRCKKGETRIWNKVVMGSTETTEGIYQVIAGLQRLAYWVNHTYWPWFQRSVL